MKPRIEQAKIEGLTAFSVTFGKPKRTVLVADTHDHLSSEENRDTFINLCYQACKTARSGTRFVYVPFDRIRKATYDAVKKELEADAVVFVAEETAKLGGRTSDLYDSLCSLHEDGTVVVIPFRYWASEHYANPNSSGNALLGFTLRGMTAAASGENLIPDVGEIKANLVYVNTMSKFEDMVERITSAKVLGFDTETTSLGKITAKILSMQFGVAEENGSYTSFFLPFEHRETPWNGAEFKKIKSVLKKWLLRTEQEFVMHGGSFDVGQLMTLLDVDFLPLKLYDTTAGEFLLDENRKSLRGLLGIPGPYRLDVIEKHHGIHRPKTSIDKEDRSRMASYSLREIFDYGCWDSITLLIIRERQLALCTNRLYGYPSKKAFRKTCVEQLGIMLKTYATMQHNGIQIDLNNLVTLARKDGPFQTAVDEIYTNLLLTSAGKKANAILLEQRGAGGGGLFGGSTSRVLDLSKPAHRTTLYFDVLGLEPLTIGKNGSGSTGADFQKAYASRYPEVEFLRQYNANTKLKTAFADSLLDIVTHDPDFQVDGRVRPGFGFLSVVSGRGSSFNPNAQQVPSRGPLSKSIKKNFTVKPGYLMCAADFSAHEVRMSGVVSRDEVIASTFRVALAAIRKFRLGPIPNDLPSALEALELEIDIHIQNCIASGEEVTTDKGLVPIEKCTPGMTVIGRYGKDTITHVLNLGHKEVVKIELSDGRTLRLTSDHKVWVFTPKGLQWKSAGSLTPKDRVTSHLDKFHLVPVKSVVPDGTSDVWDLSIENDPSFTVNGMVVHNCLIFYGKRVHKKDPLRTSIKNVVFSAIYGAMAKKIAKTSESGELQAAIDTIAKKTKELEALRKSDDPDRSAIKAIKKEIADKREIMDRPFEFYLEQAEDAFNRLEEKWHVMFEWMQTTKEQASKTFVANYPNGRIRHLWGYLSSDIWTHRAMDRRAVNSIIQGFAADIGIVSAYAATEWVYRNGYMAGVPIDISLFNIVHDACYRETLFEQLPLAVYLTEHSMSTMPYRFYRDKFDFEFTVPLGYDVDVGISWDSLEEWHKRPEMLDVLVDKFGEKLNKTTKETTRVKKDWAKIWEFRQRELEKDKPDRMLLDGDRFSDLARRLYMFSER